jgi:hypothetical protein
MSDEKPRFQGPWHVIEHTESFMVEDKDRRQLAFVYFRDDAIAARLMHRPLRDEARRIAEAIARLPSFEIV